MRSTRREARAPRRTVDFDGVVRTERGRSRTGLALGCVAALLALAVAWLFVDVQGSEPASSGEGRTAAPAQARGRLSPPRAFTAGSVDPAEVPAEPAELYVNQIDPASVEKTGIHLFPRPGTKPIKGGILVPEGFELPPGYMRHYQATDDGEPVQAILVFHPDYRPLDAAGQPIPLPADRVVPPELAPPGMAVEVLEPPPVRRDFDETSAPPPR